MTGRSVLPVSADRAYGAVRDLATYPAWLRIVQSVAPAAARPDDGGPAWLVDLGARLGPLRRTKRVRMVRTTDDPGARVCFERVEQDGREHSEWTLRAELESAGPAGTSLTMHLHYGGSAWLPGLDLILAQEVRAGAARLARHLARGPG